MHQVSLVERFRIQGHKVYLIFEKTNNDEYLVEDYFQNIVSVSCSLNDISVITSQFSLLRDQDLISAANINIETIVSSYTTLYNDSNPDLPLRANEDLWIAIKAYDLSKDSKFLHLAEGINNWILNTNYAYINDSKMSFVNFCQIAKRKRKLTSEEKLDLNAILEKGNADKLIIPMIYILLDDYQKASRCVQSLSQSDREYFLNSPIIQFCPEAFMS